jgi:hypothetical protein
MVSEPLIRIKADGKVWYNQVSVRVDHPTQKVFLYSTFGKRQNLPYEKIEGVE